MAKVLPVKLDEKTRFVAEKIRHRLKLSWNAYLCKAVSHYNALCARKLLEREYEKASRRIGSAHLEYLEGTELLEDLSIDGYLGVKR